MQPILSKLMYDLNLSLSYLGFVKGDQSIFLSWGLPFSNWTNVNEVFSNMADKDEQSYSVRKQTSYIKSSSCMFYSSLYVLRSGKYVSQ